MKLSNLNAPGLPRTLLFIWGIAAALAIRPVLRGGEITDLWIFTTGMSIHFCACLTLAFMFDEQPAKSPAK